MDISEILIIYLAIGAPIGVFAIARSKNVVTRNLVPMLAINVILWPIFASIELVPRSIVGHESKYVDGGANLAARSEGIRSIFGYSINDLGDRNFRRGALEEFDRFAALSDAVPTEAAPADIGISALFEISGHPIPSVASKCFFRQNRQKLIGHRDRAFADLHSLAGKLQAEDRTVYYSALKTAQTHLLS